MTRFCEVPHRRPVTRNDVTPATNDRQRAVTQIFGVPGVGFTPAVSDFALLAAARGGSEPCRAELWARHGGFAQEMLSWFGFAGRAADVCREELDALVACDEADHPCQVVAAQYLGRVAAHVVPAPAAAPSLPPTHTSRAFTTLRIAEQTLLWHVWANGASVVDAARYAGVAAVSASTSFEAAALRLGAAWLTSRRMRDAHCGRVLERLQRSFDAGGCAPQLEMEFVRHLILCEECTNTWETYSAIPDFVITHFGILALHRPES